ncbi:uncharacterized protein LOC143595527 [Bidens hawaiensis]|uniref:uncharacterized protein LOC143595527 n=1 Tax=Bidens hawaiensis TaxID=980011 RepID=UPI004049CF96
MDKWMAAVAAGAGSIAHHFKKFKQPSEQISSDSSNHGSVRNTPNSPKPPSDKKWKKWSFGKSSRRQSLKQDDSQVENEGDLVSEVSTRRSRMSFRRRIINRQAFRSLSSLESCAMAHVEPTMQTVTPFFVTDGSNAIFDKACAESCNVHNGSVVKNERGSLNATLLVCLGMSFGILYACVENKREVERLNRLVKQKENLIQDLEEEIEMKDSLIMQELTVDDHESQKTDSVIMKEDSYSISEIEAELEAELEMLELSMTSSSLERKISNLVELDPDFEAGVAEGESRCEMVDNIKEDETAYYANYAVCPRELSLRLHEVIQFRLEERIRELETQIEVQNQKSWNDFSSSNAGDESYEDEPVLNRSVEALDAYSEACSECANMSGDERNLDDDDDEMEMMLIKHIVEKARQGSPAVLNAQRALFSEYSLESWKFR